MNVRLATYEDLSRIMEIYSIARNYMKKTNNPNQWKDYWPPKELIEEDIKNEISYVIEDNHHIYGVFVFFIGHDDTYDVIVDGNWLDKDKEYGVIHRVASSQERRGILKIALKYADLKIDNMKIDTHFDNKVMQHILEKNGYIKCGIIYTHDGSERIAYQKLK